jgi:fatty acid-binding protein DegV
LALGQYLNYILLLEEQEPDRVLYLAVSENIYELYFHNLAVQKAIERYHIKILVFDAQLQIVKSWIE